jgi:hypothetical protein
VYIYVYIIYACFAQELPMVWHVLKQIVEISYRPAHAPSNGLGTLLLHAHSRVSHVENMYSLVCVIVYLCICIYIYILLKVNIMRSTHTHSSHAIGMHTGAFWCHTNIEIHMYRYTQTYRWVDILLEFKWCNYVFIST